METESGQYFAGSFRNLILRDSTTRKRLLETKTRKKKYIFIF